IAVMYLGKIVEFGLAEEVFEKPLHPYTKMLFASMPVPDPEATKKKPKIEIRGEPPSPINPPPGCRFHNRCPYVMETCMSNEPPLVMAEKDHFVACWLYMKK
ncbi:MAG: oligopeptide ABC transporter ATP-binding protein, partial [Desulfurococcales archaeon]|nr:oligopeptide ABC transporter ATP-binding protein [Desulfurococcales archaeon]